MTIRLTWHQRFAATNMVIYRDTSPLDLDALPAALVTLSGDATSYTDETVADDTVYHYALAAKNADDELSFAPQITVTNGTPDPGGEASVETILIPANRVNDELTNFVLGVDLSKLGDDFWDHTNNTDLVIKADGTRCPVDLVFCDDLTRTGKAYAKIPSISDVTDTELTIEVDGVATQPAVDDAYGRNSVWSDFEFAIDPYEAVVDRTGNNTPSITNGPLGFNDFEGVVGGSWSAGAAALTGTQAIVIPVADISTGSGVFTMAVSYRAISDSNQCNLITYQNGYPSGSNHITVAVDDGTHVALWDTEDSWVDPSSALNPSVDHWHRAWATYDGSVERTIDTWADGTSLNNGTDTGIPSRSGTGQDTIVLGESNSAGGFQTFSGEVGASYLIFEKLSDAWKLAENDLGFNLYGSSYAPDEVSDAFSSSVTALVRFDGADTATTQTDLSDDARAVTFSGNAAISDKIQFAGHNMLSVDGSGDFVTIDNSGADLIDASDDFCIEATVIWEYMPSGSLEFVFGIYQSADDDRGIALYTDGSELVVFLGASGGNTGNDIIVERFYPKAGYPYHIAITRETSTNTYRLFIDGVLWGADVTSADPAVVTADLAIGAQDNGSGATEIRVAELRVTSGEARYTADFDPPRAPFAAP